MRWVLRSVGRVAAIAVATVALTAVPASADVTVVEIDPTGTDIALTITNRGSFVSTSDRTGVALACTGLTASAVLPSGGSGLSPSHIVKVTSVSFSGCMVSGHPATVTATASVANPWWLDITDVTSQVVTPAKLTGFDIHTELQLLGCGWDANGAGSAEGVIPGYHRDRSGVGAPSQFHVPQSIQADNIELANVSSNCLPLFADGDTLSFAFALNVSPGLAVLAT
ncbi:hypothetical protein ACGFJT_20610 [Actinomadura geliboluensis]|uniref:hypothetical protein n=1 Tax=Actinomadura geliboluensis TaxID=882440 RepID=UPI003723F020